MTALYNLSSGECEVISKKEKWVTLAREATAHAHRTDIGQEGQEDHIHKASAFRAQLTVPSASPGLYLCPTGPSSFTRKRPRNPKFDLASQVILRTAMSEMAHKILEPLATQNVVHRRAARCHQALVRNAESGDPPRSAEAESAFEQDARWSLTLWGAQEGPCALEGSRELREVKTDFII